MDKGISASVAILRVGLQSDLERSLELVAGAGGKLKYIHEALQVFDSTFPRYKLLNSYWACSDRKKSGIVV
jgi:hypothetical protein